MRRQSRKKTYFELKNAAFDIFNLFFGIAFMTALGCVTQEYRYVPVDPQTKSPDEKQIEAFYTEPPSAPQTSIRVRSLGMVTLRPKNEDRRIPALHVRMSLFTTPFSGGGPANAPVWVLHSQEPTALFHNDGEVHPLYVNANAAKGTDVELNPGELRVVDFYFPLPEHARTAADVSDFEFKWALHKGTDTISKSTYFERVPIHENYNVIYPYEPYPVGYGPIWYDWGPPVWLPPPPPPPIRIRE